MADEIHVIMEINSSKEGFKLEDGRFAITAPNSADGKTSVKSEESFLNDLLKAFEENKPKDIPRGVSWSCRKGDIQTNREDERKITSSIIYCWDVPEDAAHDLDDLRKTMNDGIDSDIKCAQSLLYVIADLEKGAPGTATNDEIDKCTPKEIKKAETPRARNLEKVLRKHSHPSKARQYAITRRDSDTQKSIEMTIEAPPRASQSNGKSFTVRMIAEVVCNDSGSSTTLKDTQREIDIIKMPGNSDLARFSSICKLANSPMSVSFESPAVYNAGVKKYTRRDNLTYDILDYDHAINNLQEVLDALKTKDITTVMGTIKKLKKLKEYD